MNAPIAKVNAELSDGITHFRYALISLLLQLISMPDKFNVYLLGAYISAKHLCGESRLLHILDNLINGSCTIINNRIVISYCYLII